MTSLAGKTALVTGGNRGIGAAIADALAGQGADIWITGRDKAALSATAADIAARHGVSVEQAVCDVTDRAAIARLADAVKATGTDPDILVNNAGVAHSASFERLDPADWDRLLATNLTSVFALTQAFIPAMRTAGFGRVVNIASIAGLQGYGYIAAYCAAKHGLIGLTRALAVEYARTGVTVNAVCPGYTDTALVTDAVARIVDKTEMSPDKAQAALIADMPMARLVTPAEVAAAVVWLCGPGSDVVTGTSIPVAGGAVM